jgi:hypothetical protein
LVQVDDHGLEKRTSAGIDRDCHGFDIRCQLGFAWGQTANGKAALEVPTPPASVTLP